MNLSIAARDELVLDRADLPAAYRAATGQALRRTGMLAALATLACRRVLAAEVWPSAPAHSVPPLLPTTVLWHARAVVAEETMALLDSLMGRGEAVMPFEFLASQPALVGAGIAAHVPGLVNVLCLPWVDDAGTEIGQRCRQLAAVQLADGVCARVLCIELERSPTRLCARSLSLVLPETAAQHSPPSCQR